MPRLAGRPGQAGRLVSSAFFLRLSKCGFLATGAVIRPTQLLRREHRISSKPRNPVGWVPTTHISAYCQPCTASRSGRLRRLSSEPRYKGSAMPGRRRRPGRSSRGRLPVPPDLWVADSMGLCCTIFLLCSCSGRGRRVDSHPRPRRARRPGRSAGGRPGCRQPSAECPP